MRKESLLARIEQIRLEAEDAEQYEVIKIKLLDLLLEYIGNQEIREKIEEIPMI